MKNAMSGIYFVLTLSSRKYALDVEVLIIRCNYNKMQKKKSIPRGYSRQERDVCVIFIFSRCQRCNLEHLFRKMRLSEAI